MVSRCFAVGRPIAVVYYSPDYRLQEGYLSLLASCTPICPKHMRVLRNCGLKIRWDRVIKIAWPCENLTNGAIVLYCILLIGKEKQFTYCYNPVQSFPTSVSQTFEWTWIWSMPQHSFKIQNNLLRNESALHGFGIVANDIITTLRFFPHLRHY